MKILVAYDGSPGADAAVREMLQRTWHAGTEVRIVQVVEWPIAIEPPYPVGYPGPAVEAVHSILTEKAGKELARTLETVSAKGGLDVTTDLREGSPKYELLDAIETWKPDLVIAGSTGKTGLRKFLLGSVCHALVTHSPCSVLVVKSQQA